MKNYLFSKLLLIAALLAIWGTYYNCYAYELEGYMGAGTGTAQNIITQSTWASSMVYLYDAGLLADYRGAKAGIMSSISFRMGNAGPNPTTDLRAGTTFRIFLANTEDVFFNNDDCYPNSLFTEVFAEDEFTFTKANGGAYAAGDWVTLNFNAIQGGFDYKGRGIVLKICIINQTKESGGNVRLYQETNANKGRKITAPANGGPFLDYCNTEVVNDTRIGTRLTVKFNIEIPTETYTPYYDEFTAMSSSVFNNMYPSNHRFGMITDEAYKACGGFPGTIKSMSLRLANQFGDGINSADRTVRIYMATAPAGATDLSALGTSPYDWGLDKWTLVYEKQNPTLVTIAADNGVAPYTPGQWVEFQFNVADFPYTMGGIVYMFCSSGSGGLMNGGGNHGSAFYAGNTYAIGPPPQPYWGYETTTETTLFPCDRAAAGGMNMSGPVQNQLDCRVKVEATDYIPMTLISAYVQHPLKESTTPGAINFQMLHLGLRFEGRDGQARMTRLEFTNKSLPGYVTKAKLWATQGVASLNTFTRQPLAEMDIVEGNDQIVFDNLNEIFDMSTYHFWLTFDVDPDAPYLENALDVRLSGYEIYDGLDNYPPISSLDNIDTPDPEGATNVSDFTMIYCPPGVVAPEESAKTVTVPDGNTYTYRASQGANSNYGNFIRTRSVYRYDELNNGTAGLIGEMALYSWIIRSSATGLHDSVFIFMRNLPRNSGQEVTPPDFLKQRNDVGSATSMGWNDLLNKYEIEGYTRVAGPFSFPYTNEVGQWVTTILTEPFKYTGGDLDVIIHRSSIDNYRGDIGTDCNSFGHNAWEEALYAGAGYQYWTYGDLGVSENYPCAEVINSQYSTMSPPWNLLSWNHYMSNKSNARFAIRYTEGSVFKESNAFHTDKQYVSVGAKSDEVLGLMIETQGLEESPYEHLKELVFNGKGSHAYATKAMLYFSGNDSAFAAGTPIGDTITLTSSNISNLRWTFERDEVVLTTGKNYFWLAYEIADNSSNIGRTVDASFTSGILTKLNPKAGIWRDTNITNAIRTTDPAGNKIISTPMAGGTYYIGTPVRTPGFATLSEFASQYSLLGANQNTELIIISDIQDTKPAAFSYNSNNTEYGIIVSIDPAATTGYRLRSTQSGSGVIELMPGITNFTINGTNANGATLTIEKLGDAGAAILANLARNVKINNTNIIGNTNGITLNGVIGFDVTGNTITSARNYGLNVIGGSRNGVIDNNTIGSAAANVGNGLSLFDGSSNIVVSNNRFSHISSAATNSAISIRGTSTISDIAIDIYNNTINDVKSSSAIETASAFEIDNARYVRLYHNTVIFSADRGNQKLSSIFKINPSYPVILDVQNNLFANYITSSDGLYSQHYYIQDFSKITIEAENNVYAGGGAAVVRLSESMTSIYDFEQWQGQNHDINSKYVFVDGSFVSASDFHTDGDLLSTQDIMVNALDNTNYPNSMYDIDGSTRGGYLAGKVMAGADEMYPIIRNDPTSNTLPEKIEICEDWYESIILKADRRFTGWSDNVVRSYSPTITNTWITDKDETLTNTNGIDVSRYPYLYIDRPNFTHTMKVKCVSNTWFSTFETDYCDILVVTTPSMYVMPDAIFCYDAGSFEIEAANAIEGTAQAFQWQKKNGNNWDNISGQTTTKLNIAFASDPDAVAAAEGTYRLKLIPYELCANTTDAYSNEIEVTIGHPIASGTDSLNFTSSVDDIELVYDNNLWDYYKNVCVNNELWMTPTIDANLKESIMRYQWQKLDATNIWQDIETIINPTAQSDTFRIYSTKSEDAGKYRCMVYGCSEDNVVYTYSLPIKIEPATEILSQPKPVLVACIDKALTDDMSIIITDPELTIQWGEYEWDVTTKRWNIYQWFKDGKPFVRLDESGEPITSKTHPLYNTHRTDTTYLPFASAALADGGAYVLRTIYKNCEKQDDTLFSDTARLFVYSVAHLESQSTEVYATLEGYTDLNVKMSIPTITEEVIGDYSITYNWYRMRKQIDTLRDNANVVISIDTIEIIDTLQNDPKYDSLGAGLLRINNISLSDINKIEKNIISDYYYCEIFDYCSGVTTKSDSIKIKLAPDFNITEEPQSSEVCQGVDVTMTATAVTTDVTQHVMYEWYKSDESTPISRGIGRRILQIEDVDAADAADYYCVVSLDGLIGTNKQTSTATLVVNLTPKILEEIYPTGGIVAENDAFELQVVTDANGDGYTYEWYFNDTPITGATDSIYSIANATKENEGNYFVIVKNECGEQQSTPINIQIGVGIIDNNDPTFRIVSVLPNPVNTEATIKFILPEANTATLTLLDITGRVVAELNSGSFAVGVNAISIGDKLNGISSGTYFVVLESKERKASMKITINK